MPDYKIIDMETWPRRTHWNYYRNLVKAQTSMTKKIDMTNFVKWCHEKKENDEFVLNATGPYGIDSAISSVIPKEVLAGIQEIIDRYELVKNNGLNKVTAGLAPEYAPMYLSAQYAFGEKLYFRENGDPDSEWTLEIRDYLEKALIEAGCDEVRPPEEELIISRFSLIFNIDEKNHYYATLGKSKDELTLTHTVYDMNTNEKLSDEKVMVTEDMLSGLQQVFEEYDFKSLHRMESVKTNEDQPNGDFLEIYVDYENGRQIYAQYGADEIPENWPEMRDAFVRYCDEYMEKK
ncbi:MAG: CatA-like O-acetyltransferase [Eubacteriales bacterium]|nr:CatA-like O-acetyltransferase [Eubacteriales bacterium]